MRTFNIRLHIGRVHHATPAQRIQSENKCLGAEQWRIHHKNFPKFTKIGQKFGQKNFNSKKHPWKIHLYEKQRLVSPHNIRSAFAIKLTVWQKNFFLTPIRAKTIFDLDRKKIKIFENFQKCQKFLKSAKMAKNGVFDTFFSPKWKNSKNVK